MSYDTKLAISSLIALSIAYVTRSCSHMVALCNESIQTVGNEACSPQLSMCSVLSTCMLCSPVITGLHKVGELCSAFLEIFIQTCFVTTSLSIIGSSLQKCQK